MPPVGVGASRGANGRRVALAHRKANRKAEIKQRSSTPDAGASALGKPLVNGDVPWGRGATTGGAATGDAATGGAATAGAATAGAATANAATASAAAAGAATSGGAATGAAAAGAAAAGAAASGDVTTGSAAISGTAWSQAGCNPRGIKQFEDWPVDSAALSAALGAFEAELQRCKEEAQKMRAVKSGDIDMVITRSTFGGQEPRRPEGCIDLGEFTVKNRGLLKGKGAEIVRGWVFGALRAVVWQLHLRRSHQSCRPRTGAV